MILVFRTPSSCQDGKVQVRQKSMCLAAAKAGAVASCQTLACALAIMVLYAGNLKPNGTAVEGVCVTGAAIRLIVPVVSKERVTVASRYGAIFAITVRVGCLAIAVQGDRY